MTRNTTTTWGVVAAFVAAGLALLLGLPIYLMVLDPGPQQAAGPQGSGGLATGSVPAEYQQAVLAAGGRCSQVSPALIAAQLDAESDWNPTATSPVGAQGIAQFMPATWKTWGKDVNNDGSADPLDPQDAIDAQGRFMCALAAQMQTLIAQGKATGDVQSLALAAYNAGPGAVQSARGIPAITETQQYVARIKQLMTSKYAGAQTLPGTASGGILAAAMRWQGYPYVWGGGGVDGPSGIGRDGRGPGFDCSGLTQFAVAKATGITLPRTADQQIRDSRGTDLGTGHDLTKLQPGDLIAFSKNGGQNYDHIGIYAGGGKMFHAPTTGKNVQTINLARSTYFGAESWRIKRFSRAT